MNYEIPHYWPNSISTNNKTSCWTYTNFLNSPALEISKNKDRYVLKINQIEVNLSEKELIDWIFKLEMAIK